MQAYKEILDNLWNMHLQEKSENALTGISLFAGCGGSSLGYSAAGFRELCMIEWNREAVNTFKVNFPDIPTICHDIKIIDKKSILSIIGKDMENYGFAKKNITDLLRTYWNDTKPGKGIGKFCANKKIDTNKTAPTFVCRNLNMHPLECRYLTIAEMKRIGSFPDQFIFDSRRNCEKQVGNSVPPLFMHHIATELRKMIESLK